MRNLWCVLGLVSLCSACDDASAGSDSGADVVDARVMSDAAEQVDAELVADAAITLDAAHDASSATAIDAAHIDAHASPDAAAAIVCDPAACAGWLLARGASAWTTIPRDSGAFAPASPIRAAFDIESGNIAYVLTDSTYHVLRLSDRVYTSSGARDDLFEVPRGPLRFAYSVVDPGGTFEMISVESATSAQVYRYHTTAHTLEYRGEGRDTDAEWATSRAPLGDDVRGAWFAPDNERGWVRTSPATLCPTGPVDPSIHTAFITPTSVFIFENVRCQRFFTPTPYSEFTPFTLPGAPRTDQIGASFYIHGDLWILAE